MSGYLELLEEQLNSQGLADAVEDVHRVRSSASQISSTFDGADIPSRPRGPSGSNCGQSSMVQ